MNEEAGRIIDLVAENKIVPGCTVSKILNKTDQSTLIVFSLAAETNISPETYAYRKIWIVLAGDLKVVVDGEPDRTLKAGDSFTTPLNVPVGVAAESDVVYLEIELPMDAELANGLEDNTPFRLADLVPSQDGRIVNRDIVTHPALKFMIMDFAAGTGLSEHAAPGEALILALAGEGIITYEGTPHTLHPGDAFAFAKLGRHAVTANNPFKMALLLTREAPINAK